MSWATPAEATTIVGSPIEQSQLDAANAILFIYAGVTEDASDNLGKRDLMLLKSAEAFQAKWMETQVDLYWRSDADQLDQDGLRFMKGDVDAHTLAPFAKACLKKLSWKRTRTIEALTPMQALVLRGRRTAETMGRHGLEAGFDWDEDDLSGGWRPL